MEIIQDIKLILPLEVLAVSCVLRKEKITKKSPWNFPTMGHLPGVTVLGIRTSDLGNVKVTYSGEFIVVRQGLRVNRESYDPSTNIRPQVIVKRRLCNGLLLS